MANEDHQIYALLIETSINVLYRPVNSATEQIVILETK